LTTEDQKIKFVQIVVLVVERTIRRRESIEVMMMGNTSTTGSAIRNLNDKYPISFGRGTIRISRPYPSIVLVALSRPKSYNSFNDDGMK
jgi:hypothetical protein